MVASIASEAVLEISPQRLAVSQQNLCTLHGQLSTYLSGESWVRSAYFIVLLQHLRRQQGMVLLMAPVMYA